MAVVEAVAEKGTQSGDGMLQALALDQLALGNDKLFYGRRRQIHKRRLVWPGLSQKVSNGRDMLADRRRRQAANFNEVMAVCLE